MKSLLKSKHFSWDYISVAALYLIAGIFMWQSQFIKEEASKRFPIIICWLAIIMATVVLVRVLLTPIEKRPTYTFQGGGGAIFVVFSLVIYTIAITFFGFYIATPVFLYLCMMYYGVRKQKTLILVSIFTTLSIYLIFDLLLKLQMPMGYVIPKMLGYI